MSDQDQSSPLTSVYDFKEDSSISSVNAVQDDQAILHSSESQYDDRATIARVEDSITLPGRKRAIPLSNINTQDRSGRTLVFKYAARGDASATESLLKAGASLRIADYALWTPLHGACLEGRTEIVELMLAYDAEVDAKGGGGDTPLHDAVSNGHYDVVLLLLKHGASMDLVNEAGLTAEEAGVEKLVSKEILELLKDWRRITKEIVQRDETGQTPFHVACEEGSTDKVIKFLEYGADIAAVDNAGWTPLHNAALNGYEDIVDVLLRHGAPVDALGSEKESPFLDAVANGHMNCVALLLKYGADKERKNSAGKSALDLIVDLPEKEKMIEVLQRDYSQVKAPEFYRRLLISKDEEVKVAEREREPFAWGGLDRKAAGPFESSREEKKFQALLKTLTKVVEPASDEEEKSLDVPEKIKTLVVKEKEKVKGKIVAVKEKLPAPKVISRVALAVKGKEVAKSVVKREISKLQIALDEVSEEELRQAQAKRRKKLFNLAGYQGSYNSTESASLTNLLTIIPQDSPTSTIPTSTLPSATIQSATIQNTTDSAVTTTDTPTTTTDTPTTTYTPVTKGQSQIDEGSIPFKEEPVKIERDESEISLCLPLFAYAKKYHLEYYDPPETDLWGLKPHLNHTKMFIDLQLAYCLGLQSGRQLIEKYPNLLTRVASTAEKAFLETSVVSARLLTCMLQSIDSAWVKTIAHNGIEYLKMQELDIHLIFWSEDLYQILKNHIKATELSMNKSLNWIEDLLWKGPDDEAVIIIEPIVVQQKSYVHKLKRFKK